MWNWQQADWPDFIFESKLLNAKEADFLKSAGSLLGACKHIDKAEHRDLVIQLISTEAVKTSEIEGEWLSRDSVQSSLKKQFGLQAAADKYKVLPAEAGIAEVMTDLYQTFSDPLREEQLCRWNKLLLVGSREERFAGAYRSHPDAMQVVSGPIGRRKIHFEAPPSGQVSAEMKRFIAWFNRTAPNSIDPLPALVRSALAHLYFVCIHPFEDGNGRLSRLLAEKVLAQSVGEPTLISLSTVIQNKRKDYYRALAKNNRDLEVNNWLEYFANTVLEAQQCSLELIEFSIAKTKFYDRYKNKLNLRQEKVVKKLFDAGIDGFAGGLSAKNYLAITGTSRPTATRDLAGLVEMGALIKTGERKSTRYELHLER